MPWPNTVSKEVINIAKDLNKQYGDGFANIFRYEGGISCDGVQIEVTGKTYYNFILHYLAVKCRPLSRRWLFDLADVNDFYLHLMSDQRPHPAFVLI